MLWQKDLVTNQVALSYYINIHKTPKEVVIVILTHN